jgi:hypothetical protein
LDRCFGWCHNGWVNIYQQIIRFAG